MKIIQINDCKECPYYNDMVQNHGCTKTNITISDKNKDWKKILINHCPLKEAKQIIEPDACIYCEHYIQTSASTNCLHEKATTNSPDGYSTLDGHQFTNPKWCPIKKR